MLCTDAYALTVIVVCSLLAVYTSAVGHCLYRYDLRSVDESNTILHQLHAVVTDYINAFVE